MKDLFGTNGDKNRASLPDWPYNETFGRKTNKRFNSSRMLGDTDLSIVVKGVKEDPDPIPLVGRTVHWPVEALSRGEPHSLLDKDS